MFEARDFGTDRTGNIVPGLLDKTGRYSLTYFFRDVTVTGYITPTRGQETALIAGVANKWIDMITVEASNTSTAANGNYQVDIRASTGGGIQDTLVVPNNSTVFAEYLIPKMQDEQGATWTAQVSKQGVTGGANNTDISDSSIIVSATGFLNS